MIGFLLDVDPELPEDISKRLSGRGRTLAFATFPRYQRLGYMEETLKAYVPYQLQQNGTDYIHCGHFVDNDPSRRLLQKLGFTEYARHMNKDRIIVDQIIQRENGLSESELYKELGILTKKKDRWEESIPYVSSLLSHESVKIQAKALWLLGEMGLEYPLSIQDAVSAIASFRDSPVPLLRERAVNALGRIGRGNCQLIKPYWPDLFRFADDETAQVRLSFIWASENIAMNTPDLYGNYMPVFGRLLHDPDDRVRMEAPEIFRVLGKRRPEFVRPFEEQLKQISETDSNRVVRIHCLGAIKAAMGGKDARQQGL